jgi:hypothetical protein
MVADQQIFPSGVNAAPRWPSFYVVGLSPRCKEEFMPTVAAVSVLLR